MCCIRGNSTAISETPHNMRFEWSDISQMQKAQTNKQHSISKRPKRSINFLAIAAQLLQPPQLYHLLRCLFISHYCVPHHRRLLSFSAPDFGLFVFWLSAPLSLTLFLALSIWARLRQVIPCQYNCRLSIIPQL